MGEFSIFHWLVVLAVVLIFFGGRRIPEVMKGLGEGIRSFKDGMSGMAGGAAQTATAAAPAPVVFTHRNYREARQGASGVELERQRGSEQLQREALGNQRRTLRADCFHGVDELHGRRIGERHILLCSFLRRPEWRKHEFRGSERHACLKLQTQRFLKQLKLDRYSC